MSKECEVAIKETKKDLKQMMFDLYDEGVAVAVDGIEVYIDFEEVRFLCTGNVVKKLIEKAYYTGMEETKKELKNKALSFFD